MMNTRLIAFSLCLCAVGMVLSSCDNASSPRVVAALGQIKGTVVSTDGTPVSGALVRTNPATREVRSDVDGGFLIPVVPAGDYTITASISERQGAERISVASLQNTLVTITLGVNNGGGDDGGGDDGGGDDGGGDDGGGDDGGGDPGLGLPPGLIAYFPLDGSANELNRSFPGGTVKGAVKTEDRHGRSGRAMQFDGLDDIIEIPMNGNTVLQRFPMTWSYWLRPARFQPGHTANQQVPIGIYLHPTGDGVVFLWEGNVFACVYSTLNFVNWTRVDARLPQDGQWHHVVMTVSNEGMVVYIDGKLAGDRRWSGRPTMSTSPEPLRIGGTASVHPTMPTRPFAGAIDEVMMFNRVLTQDEIRFLHQR